MDQFIDHSEYTGETTTYPEPTRKKSSGSLSKNLVSLSLILAIGVLFGLGIKSFFTIFDPPPEITEIRGELPLPTPTISTDPIAFTRAGNLFLLENGVERQLTTTGDVGTFKWFPDGKSIAFIQTKTFDYQNTQNGSAYTQTFGSAIFSFDLSSGNISELVSQKYTDGVLKTSNFEEKRDYGLWDFDFSPDRTKIVYIRDGVWIVHLQDQTEEQIANNFFGGTDKVPNNYAYREVLWNPVFQTLLFRKGFYEGSATEIYDIVAKTISEVTSPSFGFGDWSPDGRKIVFSSQQGMFDGGLWFTDAKTLQTERILGEDDELPEQAISVYSASIAKDGRVLAIVGPMLDNVITKSALLPSNGKNIYIITDDKKLVPLTRDTDLNVIRRNLTWSPKGDKIGFTQILNRVEVSVPQVPYDLHLLNPDGTNDQVVLTAITDYAWQPVSSN